jgi:cyclophilin family peptidyl-prolyl cis-trans isomerase
MSKSAKRQRQRENRMGARATRVELARKARQRRTLITAGALGVVVIAAGVLLAAVNSGDDKKVTTTGSQGEKGAKSTSSSTTATTVSAAVAAVTCDDRKPDPPKADRPTFTAPPPMTIDPAKKYTATFDTSCGKIVAELDAKNAPKTTNNFVFLARKGFYDGLTFHRVAKDFVIQGGDPQGTGTGGPGYQFEDEPPKDDYEIGSLAMANSGPNTNGSQFFIVTGPNGTSLPHNYSKFGKVTAGVEVAQKMETFLPEGKTDSTPTRPLYMFKVEITESAA